MVPKNALHANLTPQIRKLQEKVKRFRDRRLGEQNTKTSLIEPVLAALGWEVQDPDEVDQEFKANRRDNPVDYALLLEGRPRMLVEAKGLGENLDERRWISQVLGYAVTAGVEWCVLTDGNQFCFFKATAPVDAQEKLFCKVVLTSDPLERCVDLLSLIARDELENNRLEHYWFTHHVSRQIRTVLDGLLRTADPSLVRLIKKNAKAVTGKEISDALRRLNVKIEAGAEAIAKRPRSRIVRGKQGSKRARSTLAGLKARFPLDLYCSYHGKELKAVLLAPGVIQLGDQSFTTPTAAAIEAIRRLGGTSSAVNGWGFWKLRKANGRLVQLSTLRSS